MARITAEAGMRDAAAAMKISSALDQAAAATTDSLLVQSAMHYGRGMLAIAKGDATDARAHFDQYSREDELCKRQGVVAAEKAGDTASAATARSVAENYARDPLHLIMRSRLTIPTT